MKHYVIKSDIEKDYVTGEPLYWENEEGWGLRECATRFTAEEIEYFKLPLCGDWEEE